MKELNQEFFIEMFRCVSEGDLKNLQELLSNAADALDTLEGSDKVRKKLDLMRDSSGNSILHLAVASNALPILQILLALDLSLDVVDQEDRTPLDLAKQLVAANKCNPILVQALELREGFQEALPNFSLNRAIKLIKRSLLELLSGNGHDKVLFIGPTGAGKSTLLNYLNGTQYTLYKRVAALRARPVLGGVSEVAKTSDKGSETLYPQVVKDPKLSFAYCDLAGLFDTRGSEESVAAAISAMLLSKSEGNIKGIVVVLDLNNLSSSQKGFAFRKTAAALALMLKQDPSLVDAVRFAITKVPADRLQVITSTDIIELYVQPLLATLSSDGDADEQALISMLRTIAAKPENIFIPNITDVGVSRENIIRSLSGLEPKAIEMYNFDHYDDSKDDFFEVLTEVCNGFLLRLKRINQEYPEGIANLHQLKVAHLAQIAKNTQLIESLNIEIVIQDKIDQLIQNWKEVEELQQKLKPNVAQINSILQTNARLLAEVNNAPKQELPERISRLQMITSVTAAERTALLKAEFANRRWQLPWNEDNSPNTILTAGISKLTSINVESERLCKEISSKIAECQQYILTCKMELELMQDIYAVAAEIIEILALDDKEYRAFREEYYRFITGLSVGLRSSEIQQRPLLFTPASGAPTVSLASRAAALPASKVAFCRPSV